MSFRTPWRSRGLLGRCNPTRGSLHWEERYIRQHRRKSSANQVRFQPRPVWALIKRGYNRTYTCKQGRLHSVCIMYVCVQSGSDSSRHGTRRLEDLESFIWSKNQFPGRDSTLLCCYPLCVDCWVSTAIWWSVRAQRKTAGGSPSPD